MSNLKKIPRNSPPHTRKSVFLISLECWDAGSTTRTPSGQQLAGALRSQPSECTAPNPAPSGPKPHPAQHAFPCQPGPRRICALTPDVPKLTPPDSRLGHNPGAPKRSGGLMKKGRSERALSRLHSGRNAVGLDPGWLQTSVLQNRIPPAAFAQPGRRGASKEPLPVPKFMSCCPMKGRRRTKGLPWSSRR